MPATASYSCIIRLKAELKTDNGEQFWTLTSDDLPGLLLGGRDPMALYADTPAVIRSLFKHNYGMDVTVLRAAEVKALAEDTHQPKFSHPGIWTAIPIAA